VQAFFAENTLGNDLQFNERRLYLTAGKNNNSSSNTSSCRFAEGAKYRVVGMNKKD